MIGQAMSLDYFGSPFSHPDHPSEQWVRHDKAIVDKVSLPSIICQQSFFLVLVRSADAVLRISSTPLRKPDDYARATFGSEHGSNKRGPATRARHSKRPSVLTMTTNKLPLSPSPSSRITSGSMTRVWRNSGQPTLSPARKAKTASTLSSSTSTRLF